MNFLAHAVLSFENPDIIVGNFIADFVKGNDYLEYPEVIKSGILLHREIDQFTDQHLLVKKSKRRLYEDFGHYSGVIVDMYYDHFLAANFFKFQNTPLTEFTQSVYKIVKDCRHPIPEKASRMLYYMYRDNWLLAYSSIQGIEKALTGMSQRTKFESRMELAGKSLRLDYYSFYQEFMVFFPKVMKFARQEIELI